MWVSVNVKRCRLGRKNLKMLLRRLFHHTSLVSLHTSEVVKSSPSLLSTLRKKTGYAIANCKKALELNDNDIGKVCIGIILKVCERPFKILFLTYQAESWLNSQAQTQGWAKAAKLQNRSTPNGLVGLAFDNKSAVLVRKFHVLFMNICSFWFSQVEVNCETDFVAKNDKFQSLVAQITGVCFRNAKAVPHVRNLKKIISLKVSIIQKLFRKVNYWKLGLVLSNWGI